MQKIKNFWQLIRDAGAGFHRHRVLKLSASLAYYTVFSIGPMLLVVIFFANLFWGRQAIEGKVYGQISAMVGDGAALQIQEILKNASVSGSSFTAVIGFVALVVAATTAFIEMQDSINTIWNLKIKENTGWKLMIKNRLLSFSIVAGLGFLLLVSLVTNALLEGFMNKLQQIFPHVAVVVIYVSNLLLTLLVVAGLFAIIFKVLPDAIIRWKDVAAGALFTAVLFMIGKFCITFYISKTNVASTYGTASSLVVLLLWIYYSSVILYFGAEFTKAYALKYGSEIKPNKYAVTVQVVRVESGENSVQENEKKAQETERSMQRAKETKKIPA
ncbi:MAG: YihY/virulence factor BrkB family protein [Chitinophagaceae bacterium]